MIPVSCAGEARPSWRGMRFRTMTFPERIASVIPRDVSPWISISLFVVVDVVVFSLCCICESVSVEEDRFGL